eukprot:TRINITY_DN5893_c6_g1_i1.p1 TRINITY_DN5893_c6_g1~~TRINITY_DN5893_c6_g1_i1.p1  ORF type:complete len:451 (+),score=83.72 TRINITY_DN5893_c6_g1_i1:53-1354(+)
MRTATAALILSTSASALKDDGWKTGLQFGDGGNMVLEMMPDSVASGAVCIDGTPSGYYFQPAANLDQNANNWQIYFQGGGWCYDTRDCWERSKGSLGSSKSWANTSSMGGIMSSDCETNPDFCNFNRVHIPYCDGNSFSGNRDDPIEYEGVQLHFRGKRIIDEVLKTLSAKYKLQDAENVLLTGCSAGGLATYLHTNYVGDWFHTNAKNLKRFKAASISGFFLDHTTIENQPVYPTEMKNIFELSNATHGVNSDCIAAMQPADQWKCNFAQFSYQHIRYPIMALNSALDSWQTNCIYTSVLPPNFPNQTGTENGLCAAITSYQNCTSDPEKCNSTQMVVMNKYIQDFEAIMTKDSSATYNKPGNGAFIHSCHTHCEAQSDAAWNQFTVNGMSMRLATMKWWESLDTTPAAANSYTPCQYHTGATGPRKCNPTC